MASTALFVHRGARLVDRPRLDQVKAPPPTATWFPVTHARVLDTTDDDLSVRFDALLRVDGVSPLGDFHYQPVIFHEAEKVKSSRKYLAFPRTDTTPLATPG